MSKVNVNDMGREDLVVLVKRLNGQIKFLQQQGAPQGLVVGPNGTIAAATSSGAVKEGGLPILTSLPADVAAIKQLRQENSELTMRLKSSQEQISLLREELSAKTDEAKALSRQLSILSEQLVESQSTVEDLLKRQHELTEEFALRAQIESAHNQTKTATASSGSGGVSASASSGMQPPPPSLTNPSSATSQVGYQANSNNNKAPAGRATNTSSSHPLSITAQAEQTILNLQMRISELEETLDFYATIVQANDAASATGGAGSPPHSSIFASSACDISPNEAPFGSSSSLGNKNVIVSKSDFAKIVHQQIVAYQRVIRQLSEEAMVASRERDEHKKANARLIRRLEFVDGLAYYAAARSPFSIHNSGGEVIDGRSGLNAAGDLFSAKQDQDILVNSPNNKDSQQKDTAEPLGESVQQDDMSKPSGASSAGRKGVSAEYEEETGRARSSSDASHHGSEGTAATIIESVGFGGWVRRPHKSTDSGAQHHHHSPSPRSSQAGGIRPDIGGNPPGGSTPATSTSFLQTLFGSLPTIKYATASPSFHTASLEEYAGGGAANTRGSLVINRVRAGSANDTKNAVPSFYITSSSTSSASVGGGSGGGGGPSSGAGGEMASNFPRLNWDLLPDKNLRGALSYREQKLMDRLNAVEAYIAEVMAFDTSRQKNYDELDKHRAELFATLNEKLQRQKEEILKLGKEVKSLSTVNKLLLTARGGVGVGVGVSTPMSNSSPPQNNFSVADVERVTSSQPLLQQQHRLCTHNSVASQTDHFDESGKDAIKQVVKCADSQHEPPTGDVGDANAQRITEEEEGETNKNKTLLFVEQLRDELESERERHRRESTVLAEEAERRGRAEGVAIAKGAARAAITSQRLQLESALSYHVAYAEWIEAMSDGLLAMIKAMLNESVPTATTTLSMVALIRLQYEEEIESLNRTIKDLELRLEKGSGRSFGTPETVPRAFNQSKEENVGSAATADEETNREKRKALENEELETLREELAQARERAEASNAEAQQSDEARRALLVELDLLKSELDASKEELQSLKLATTKDGLLMKEYTEAPFETQEQHHATESATCDSPSSNTKNSAVVEGSKAFALLSELLSLAAPTREAIERLRLLTLSESLPSYSSHADPQTAAPDSEGTENECGESRVSLIESLEKQLLLARDQWGGATRSDGNTATSSYAHLCSAEPPRSPSQVNPRRNPTDSEDGQTLRGNVKQQVERVAGEQSLSYFQAESSEGQGAVAEEEEEENAAKTSFYSEHENEEGKNLADTVDLYHGPKTGALRDDRKGASPVETPLSSKECHDETDEVSTHAPKLDCERQSSGSPGGLFFEPLDEDEDRVFVADEPRTADINIFAVPHGIVGVPPELTGEQHEYSSSDRQTRTNELSETERETYTEGFRGGTDATKDEPYEALREEFDSEAVQPTTTKKSSMMESVHPPIDAEAAETIRIAVSAPFEHSDLGGHGGDTTTRTSTNVKFANNFMYGNYSSGTSDRTTHTAPPPPLPQAPPLTLSYEPPSDLYTSAAYAGLGYNHERQQEENLDCHAPKHGHIKVEELQTGGKLSIGPAVFGDNEATIVGHPQQAADAALRREQKHSTANNFGFCVESCVDDFGDFETTTATAGALTMPTTSRPPAAAAADDDWFSNLTAAAPHPPQQVALLTESGLPFSSSARTTATIATVQNTHNNNAKVFDAFFDPFA